MPETSRFSRITQIKPQETLNTALAFLFIFTLMASYMILRPVRDALPSDWGDVSRATQWSYTFIVSTIAVSLYNLCAAKLSLKKLVPSTFIFFAISFFAIYSAFSLGFDPALLGKIFYVWSSVFSLFHLSVFWSYISQHHSKEQSKRLFGLINTGASAGAIAGPLIVILLVKSMELQNILLVTGIALCCVLPIIFTLNRRFADVEHSNESQSALNPNPFSGFAELITHKRLLGIASFIFLFSGISTFFYVTQSDLLADYSSSERKELLGSLDLITNTLTILLGAFAANRISRKFGLSTALSIVPFITAALLILLSFNPATFLVLALQVLRKAGNYAITRPAREILYTGVDKEARFKTKPIIDVAVYRGADVFWIWVLAFLGDGFLNLSLPARLAIGAGVALLWGTLGVYLGRRHENDEYQSSPNLRYSPDSAQAPN
ncbi:NTP/NDP exchange transporter [Rubritalea tangerina]|uniref:NTP/NDP exchange transporter n=1 Tax=Rubritalea tangerina TaxID=430798 RepID=A0ABW4Z6I5_9BACT